MGALSTIDLPPARAALAADEAEAIAVEKQLHVLREGRHRLQSDIETVKASETELSNLVSEEARTIAEHVKSGLNWALDAINGVKAQRLHEQLAASKIRAEIGERSLTLVEKEIAKLEGHLQELKDKKPARIAAVLRESAQGIFDDWEDLITQIQDTAVHLVGLERELGVQRVGRTVATLPDFLWTDRLAERAVPVPERAIARARAVWSAFAEKLAADPLASVDLLDFPPTEQDEVIVYSDLTQVERRHLDSQNL